MCFLAVVPFVETRIARLHYDIHLSDVGAAASRREVRTSEVPLLLLHGLFMDSTMWRHQIEPCRAVTTVLAFDGPCHGKSAPGLAASLETQADAFVDALDALGVERAVVCGLSWGGMLAMRIALRHPGRTAGLVLCDTSARNESPFRRFRLHTYADVLERYPLTPRIARHVFLPRMYGRRMLAREPSLYEETYQRIRSMHQPVLNELSRSVIDRSNVLAELTQYRGPVLLVCGESDHVTPIHETELMSRAMPHAAFVRVPEVGHFAPCEAPDVVNAHLVPFVRSCIASAL